MTAAVRGAMAMLGVAVALLAAGCAPEPAAAPAGSASTATTAASRPSAAPTAEPTPGATASDDIAVPSACAALYSAEMTATLNAQLPPLNDPGVTLFSSQNSAALELLDSGIPTLRCTWGAPSTAGLATNVSIVGADAARSLQNALAAEGFGCEAVSGGTECSIQKQTIDLDDKLVTTGEVHYFRGNGWICTAYVDVIPDGYTQDIVDVLWG